MLTHSRRGERRAEYTVSRRARALPFRQLQGSVKIASACFTPTMCCRRPGRSMSCLSSACGAWRSGRGARRLRRPDPGAPGRLGRRILRRARIPAGRPDALDQRARDRPPPGGLFVNEFEQERVADVGSSWMRAGGAMFARRWLPVRARHPGPSRAGRAFCDAATALGYWSTGSLSPGPSPATARCSGSEFSAPWPGPNGRLPVFDELENLPTRLFPARSQLVLVSPLGRTTCEMLSATARARLPTVGDQP